MSDASAFPAARRRLVYGAATNWLAFAATLLVGFFLTPYLVRRLGDGPFGIWAFVESVLAYFTLFDLGIAACVVRFVARYQAAGSRDELNRLVSTTLALFLGLGGLMFAVGVAVLPLVLGSVRQAGIPAAEIDRFALLMLANLAVTLPLSVFPSVLDGLERFALKSLVRVIVLAIRTVGTVAIMEHQPSLWHLGLLFTACNLLEHGAFAILAGQLLPDLTISPRRVDRETLRLVRGYSLHAFLAMVAGRTCVQSGVLIVGAFLGAAPVTYFALAARLVEFAKGLLRAATNTLTPAVSAREAAGDHDGIRRVFLHGTRWVLYLILPVHLGLIVFGRPFLTVWLGDPSYAADCYPVLLILSAPLSVVVAQSIAARVLYGTGRLRTFSRVALLEAVANVLIGLVLVPFLGLTGVALGVAVPSLAMCLWVIGHTARGLDVGAARYLMDGWARPLAAATVPLAVWLLADGPVQGWLDLAAAIGMGLVPYAVTVLACEGRIPGITAGRLAGFLTRRTA